MVTFRNNNSNNRRSNFRRNDRNFKSNGERQKFSSNFTGSDNFKRKSPGRNNHNAPKLIEKYNNLAREALSSGDKILSENYFQHADHFTRILNEQGNYKKSRYSLNTDENKDLTDTNKNNEQTEREIENNKTAEKSEEESEAKIAVAK